MLFTEYAENLWDWDTSLYIKRRNQEKPNSISKKYASDQLLLFRNKVAPYLKKNLKISEFKVSMAENIKRALLDKKMSSSVINKVMQSIRTPLSEAYLTGVIKEDLAARVKNVASGNQREKGIPTQEEALALLNELHESAKAEDLYCYNKYLCVALAMYTGLRGGEIRALHESNIVIKGETAQIHVTHAYNDKDGLKVTKGKESRIVPAPLPLCQEILEYAKLNPGGYIFFSIVKPSVPVCSHLMLAWLRDAFQKTGITKENQKERNLTFHSLRHFYVTSMRNAGVSIESTKLIVGHKSDLMTNHYTHETDAHLASIDQQRESILPYPQYAPKEK